MLFLLLLLNLCGYLIIVTNGQDKYSVHYADYSCFVIVVVFVFVSERLKEDHSTFLVFCSYLLPVIIIIQCNIAGKDKYT